MTATKSELQRLVRETLLEMLEEDLDAADAACDDEDLTNEMNTTGSVGGEYSTPFAFTSNRKKQDKKWRDIHSQLGYTVVRDVEDQSNPESLGESTSIEAVQDMNALLNRVPTDDEMRDDEGKTFNNMKLRESRARTANSLRRLNASLDTLNESRSTYGVFKEDGSKSPRHKLASAIKDVKHALREVQEMMSLLKKFKTESNLSPDEYWKRTHINFSRIKEYVIRMVRDLKELQQ